MKKPDGSPAGNYWKLLRGKPAPGPNKAAMGLHLVFEVPASEGFVVGDIKIGNRTIQYGGQFAEKITVGLFGLVCNEGQSANPGFKCGVQPPAHPAAPRSAWRRKRPPSSFQRAPAGRFEAWRWRTLPGPAAEELLEGHEIQGNVLAGFNKDHQVFLFLRIERDGGGPPRPAAVAAVKAWLRALAPQISSLSEVHRFNELFRAMRARLGAILTGSRRPG